jgi:flagellar biosynthesis protein FlgN
MHTDTQRLGAVLTEQIRAAEAMLETLGRESRALSDGDHEALDAATDAKARLVDVLEKLESERRELVHGDDAGDAPDWQRLRELVARCKDENQRNGTLLKARAETVRVALKTLRGSEPDLYGATGRTPTRADARKLGTA